MVVLARKPGLYCPQALPIVSQSIQYHVLSILMPVYYLNLFIFFQSQITIFFFLIFTVFYLTNLPDIRVDHLLSLF